MTGATLALLAAVLFGASTPLAKLLLGTIDPWLLAGVFYFAAGLALATSLVVGRAYGRETREAPLRRRDLPRLAAVTLFGGLLGPLLLLYGLDLTPASSASLLLNLEGLATMAIAWVVFKENVDRRILLGAFAILAGAVALSWPQGPIQPSWGGLLIAAACLAWGIDNNLTRTLSSADPVQIAAVKGLAAGAVNLALAFGRGAPLPALPELAGAAIVGVFGYGISLVLFVLALRQLGTARTGAYFSTAPFIGAVLAIALLGETIKPELLLAAVLMGIGVAIHLTERHAHEHVHEPLTHEHRHVHDAHHQHDHDLTDPPGEPHAHPHRHERFQHRHTHYPDLHHRHDH